MVEVQLNDFLSKERMFSPNLKIALFMTQLCLERQRGCIKIDLKQGDNFFRATHDFLDQHCLPDIIKIKK